MKLRLTLTAGANSGVAIQDPNPVEGVLRYVLAAGQTKTFLVTAAQYNHLRSQLDSLISAGKLTAVSVVDLEEERTEKHDEMKMGAPPAAKAGYVEYYAGADGMPHAVGPTGIDYNMGLAGSAPMVWKGSIAAAADFPLLTAVVNGWVYTCTANVTDNAGGGRTNTGQSFLKGDEIVWNSGTSLWVLLAGVRSQTAKTTADTGYTLVDADELLLVDATAGIMILNIPTAVGRAGKKYEFVDDSAAGSTNAVTITPAGAEKIGGAATYVTWGARWYLAIESDGVNWVVLSNNKSLDDHGDRHISTGSDAIPDAVSSGASGLMSGADKAALDSVVAMDVFTEQGDILYEGAAGPAALAHGTVGQVLKTFGNAADPAWVDSGSTAFTPVEPVPGTIWAAPPGPPATIQDAIDRIATQLAAVGLVPIP